MNDVIETVEFRRPRSLVGEGIRSLSVGYRGVFRCGGRGGRGGGFDLVSGRDDSFV